MKIQWSIAQVRPIEKPFSLQGLCLPFVSSVSFHVSPSFRGCRLSPLVCLVSFLLSPCWLPLSHLSPSIGGVRRLDWHCRPVWPLSPFLSLHLSSSMAAFSFTLFSFVSLCRPLLAGLVAVFPSFGLCLSFVSAFVETYWFLVIFVYYHFRSPFF